MPAWQTLLPSSSDEQLSDLCCNNPHKHCCVQVLCRRGDAGSALAAASRLAAQQGSLAAVPSWALMPSSLQRHWIK
jgi:hypothetical protein